MNTVVTKEELFLSQAPRFNFELDSDLILKRALEFGFVTQVGEDQYEINDKYIELEDGTAFTESDSEDVMTVISKESDLNICDEIADGKCRGGRFFSDGEYSITWHCEGHFRDLFDSGVFKLV